MLRDRNLELDNDCIFDKNKFTLLEIVEFIVWLNKIIVHNRRIRFYDCKGGCYQSIRKGEEWFCISRFLSEDVMTRMAPKDIRLLIDMLYLNPKLNYDGEFDNYENLINVQNGVIEAETGKLISHDSKYYFTSCLNVEYIENPSVYDAPAYRHFCKTSLGDNPQKIKLSRQILGYLCSSYTKVKEAYAIIGEKNSGKSKYLELTEMIVGADKVSMTRFGKRIVSYFDNYACFFGVHQNTEHIHAHFVLNSVGFDGKKFSQSKSDLKRLKNEVCRIWKEVYSNEKAVFSEQQVITHPSSNKNYGYINTAYVPNISSGYIPSVYRRHNGAYYPVLTYMNQMVTAIDEKTDICPMIMIIDDNGNMMPGI